MMSFSDADYAGCRVDKKSTRGTCQFLKKLPCFVVFKKYNSVVLSTAEAEYIAAGAYCAQVFWMKQTLLDYDLHYHHIKIFCDNTSNIHMTKNANQYSKTNNIDIRYHFLRDHFEKGDTEIDYVFTDFQLADIFVKPIL